tara:strand:- start:14920 stop:15795 length:876 start_codon:yes stop_codon:yes gene_type:complete
MSKYTIEQFSQITGLNKILIRTWENRYDFLNPNRSATNIRLYDDYMLTKGIKFSILVKNGYKISKLTKFKDQDINNLIENTLEKSIDNNVKNKIYISNFIESALYFNQDLFDKNYNECIKKIGLLKFYEDVLFETMKKISVLFLNATINPSNEHFLSENIRLKLSAEIEKNKNNIKNKKPWILFLPENEYHDIGLLFSYLILLKNKQKVIYLGQNIPRESIVNTNHKEANLLMFVNTKKKPDFLKNLTMYLTEKLQARNIYIVCNNQEIIEEKQNNIKFLSKINDLIKLVK